MSAAIAQEPAGASGDTGFRGVVAAGVLHGLTLSCDASLTFLVDAELATSRARAGATALRLLAGACRPRSGAVRSLGADPALDAAIRRDVALLGDDLLVDRALPLDRAAHEVALVRRVAPLDTIAGARAAIAALPAEVRENPAAARRAIADQLASADRARLLLVSYPERDVRPGAREAIATAVHATIARGGKVVIATTSLDPWLFLARDCASAIGAILLGGVVLVTGLASTLPWATPVDGTTTRLVRIVLEADPPLSAPPALGGDAATEDEATHAPADVAPFPSARLAASLLSDAAIAAAIASIEPASATELRVHTRDPRALARAIGARAHAGLAVRQLLVQGASATTLAGTLMGARR